MEEIDLIESFYKEKGLANFVGFGKYPLVLVVDLINGFTNPTSPLGTDMTTVVKAVRRLIDSARTKAVPIVFTSIAYENPERDAGLWIKKIPSLMILRYGSHWVDVDERLQRRPEEILLVKPFPSAFSCTDLQAKLQCFGIDCIILCGATTSGCIRATAVDALQHGFRCIIPKEGVGDRAELPHDVNLMDINAKYGDVIELRKVIEYIENLEGKK